jgi:hypothetical protein
MRIRNKMSRIPVSAKNTLTVRLEAVLLLNVVFVCQEGGLNRSVPTAAAQRREVGRLVQHLAAAPSTIS